MRRLVWQGRSREFAICGKRARPLLGLMWALFVHPGCGSPTSPPKPYQYTVPQQFHDGWATASLNSQNIDHGPIETLVSRINNSEYPNLHSVLLVRNGKLVLEEYVPGRDGSGQYRAFTRDTLHEQHSVTKSVTSMLIGMAIDQHLIRGADETIAAFFPEYADLFANPAKGRIRLRHLLSMTAGLEWNEWQYPYTDGRNDLLKMLRSPDVVRYALARPVAAEPGTRFGYNGGLTFTLGEILYKASGMRADTFAERFLFAPLGISSYSWERFPSGVINTGGGLSLRPRDMAKVGTVVLNGGQCRDGHS